MKCSHVALQYLPASIKYNDAKVPSLFTTICKIPFSMTTVPSACILRTSVSQITIQHIEWIHIIYIYIYTYYVPEKWQRPEPRAVCLSQGTNRCWEPSQELPYNRPQSINYALVLSEETTQTYGKCLAYPGQVYRHYLESGWLHGAPMAESWTHQWRCLLTRGLLKHHAAVQRPCCGYLIGSVTCDLLWKAICVHGCGVNGHEAVPS